MFYISTYQELLEPLHKVSLFLQRDNITVGGAFMLLQSTINMLDEQGVD